MEFMEMNTANVLLQLDLFSLYIDDCRVVDFAR